MSKRYLRKTIGHALPHASEIETIKDCIVNEFAGAMKAVLLEKANIPLTAVPTPSPEGDAQQLQDICTSD
jgi:hypothetical protein